MAKGDDPSREKERKRERETYRRRRGASGGREALRGSANVMVSIRCCAIRRRTPCRVTICTSVAIANSWFASEGCGSFLRSVFSRWLHRSLSALSGVLVQIRLSGFFGAGSGVDFVSLFRYSPRRKTRFAPEPRFSRYRAVPWPRPRRRAYRQGIPAGFGMYAAAPQARRNIPPRSAPEPSDQGRALT